MANGDDKKRGDSGGERARATDPSDILLEHASLTGTCSRARTRPMTPFYKGRVMQVVDWLARGEQVRPCTRRVMQEFGLSRRMADHYVAAALKVMHHDDNVEPIESKAARLKAMLYDNIRQAKERTRTVVTKEGESVTEPAPDLAAANQAIAMLAQLELGGTAKR